MNVTVVVKTVLVGQQDGHLICNKNTATTVTFGDWPNQEFVQKMGQ